MLYLSPVTRLLMLLGCCSCSWVICRPREQLFIPCRILAWFSNSLPPLEWLHGLSRATIAGFMEAFASCPGSLCTLSDIWEFNLGTSLPEGL